MNIDKGTGQEFSNIGPNKSNGIEGVRQWTQAWDKKLKRGGYKEIFRIGTNDGNRGIGEGQMTQVWGHMYIDKGRDQRYF